MGDFTFHVGARRAQAQGRDHQADRARARPAAPVRAAAGHADRPPRAGQRRFHRQRARHRRADQPAAPQDRDRSGQSRLPADRSEAKATYSTPTEASVGEGWQGAHARSQSRELAQAARRDDLAAQGLGAHVARRSASWPPRASTPAPSSSSSRPIVLLESVVAFAFMERHWNQVTRRLSEGLARDIAAIVDSVRAKRSARTTSPSSSTSAQNRFGFSVAVLPAGNLPTPQPKPFFDLLDRALSDEIRAQREAAVLDRHRRPVAARGDPRQARSAPSCASSPSAARPTRPTRTSS